jgi:hypothetical protein
MDRKEYDRLKAKRYREAHPDYNKDYAKKIRPVFNDKYSETMKNNYQKNKDKIKNKYLAKKEFLQFCKINI